jgi:tripartite-type tricarboxylate transporter receptor subunit TctC
MDGSELRARHVAAKLAVGFFLAFTFSWHAVLADEYPGRAIRIVVPFAAGGPSDTAGRIAAAMLTNHIGQNVYVENRTGGGGVIGAEAVAEAPGDGYTLLLSDAASFIVAPIVQNVSYDTAKEFIGLGEIANSPQALVVNNSSPFKSVRELIEFAKVNPGKLSFGSAGVGTTTHLSLLLLQQDAGVSLVHVPYRGTSLSVADLMGGSIDGLFGDAATLAPLVQSGRVRVLATTGDTRASVLPDVPTMSELGFKEVRMANWFGLHARSTTPSPVVDRLRTAVAAMQTDPDFTAKIKGAGTSPGPVGAQAFEQMIQEDRSRLEPLIRSLPSH